MIVWPEHVCVSLKLFKIKVIKNAYMLLKLISKLSTALAQQFGKFDLCIFTSDNNLLKNIYIYIYSLKIF